MTGLAGRSGDSVFPTKVYLSLFFALGMTALVEFTDVYSRYRKDWRSLYMLPALIGQLALPEIAVTIAFMSVLDFGMEAPFLKNNILLLAASTGMFVHFLPHLILGKKWPEIPKFAVAKYRMKLAIAITRNQACRTILNMSIVDDDLSSTETEELKALVSTDPLTEEMVLYVIKCVGAARVEAACNAYTGRKK